MRGGQARAQLGRGGGVRQRPEHQPVVRDGAALLTRGDRVQVCEQRSEIGFQRRPLQMQDIEVR